MKKIWIDTDIGGDIDDALALLLALSSDCEILGVSTVFENTLARAKIAKTLLNMANVDVPVYKGFGMPYKTRKVFYDKVDDKKLPKTYIKEEFDDAIIEPIDAIEGLKKCLDENDDVTVVTLGALTNLARFIETYPSYTNKIKELVIMGGAIGMNLNEFNISCDPDAAKIVLQSSIKKKMVSLDVTFRCELNKEQIDRLLSCKSKLVQTVMNMSKMWGHGMILHDPLSLQEAISNDFVTFVPCNLDVITKGKYYKGKLVNLCDFNWHKKPRKDLQVSYDVKNKEFCEYYVNKILELDTKVSKLTNK